MSYARKAKRLLPALIASLERHNFSGDSLVFGGKEDPAARIHVPTHADSKFIAEQALGDWAEICLAGGIDAAFPEWKTVHYGSSGKLMAGDAGFAEEYRAGTLDMRKYGKRPDLLLLPARTKCAKDISAQPTKDLRDLVKLAVGSVEVRSSRMDALIYIAERQRQVEGTKRAALEPSITVKIEDLQKVYRWIERYDTPQAYAQVFFDIVVAMNFIDIMQYIGDTQKLKIEMPARSRKTTIMIPLSRGTRVGTVVTEPDFEVEQQRTPTGRRIIYPKPVGGKIVIDRERFIEAIEAG